MNAARAVVWAQWRNIRNFYPRAGIGWTAIIGLIWYGIWIAVAAAVMVLISSPMADSTLSGLFLLIFLYWQVVPLLMAASGA